MAHELKVPPEQRAALRRAIGELAAEGLLVEGKKGNFTLRAGSGKALAGSLKFHPKGHAMFFPDQGDASNLATGLDLKALARVHIPRRDASTALDGDRVLVSIHQPKPGRDPRDRRGYPQDPATEIRGKVEKILSRRSGRLVGVFRHNRNFGWIDCDDKAIDGTIDVVGDTTAQPGQCVVVELEPWNDPTTNPRGRIIEVLGWPGEAGVDMRAVIHRFGLRTSFPEPVLLEARAVPDALDAAEIARREDWRQALVITIDPADAKDHDDALWVETKSDGWRLAVHIADVSHYIKPGSAMDREASERGNSTYLVDRVLPMLPVELSNGLCSLKPNVDRLTKCALLDVSGKGEITKARFLDAVIHSRAKLSYEQAQAILDLRLQKLTGLESELDRARRSSGSIDTVTLERESAKVAEEQRRSARRLAALQRRDRVVQDRVQRGRVVVPGEELLPRERLPEHHAQRPEVRPGVDRRRPDLLRGHVRDLALDLPGGGQPGLGAALRDAEVEELHPAVAGDENVVRRHVAMHQLERAPVAGPRPVRVPEASRCTGDDGHAHRGAEVLPARHALLQQAQQVCALEALHDDDRQAADLADLEHLHDVRVPELRRDARLLPEHLQEPVVLRQVRQHALQHHDLRGPVVGGLPRQEHFGHAAARKLPEDLVPCFEHALCRGPRRR